MPTLEPPHRALDRLLERLSPVGVERTPLGSAVGRVLAEPVTADRDSPAGSVSAMDGYAVRVDDLDPGTALAVHGEARAGRAGVKLRAGSAVRVSTGACVPEEADAVVPREHLEEHGQRIVWSGAPAVRRGQFIRRRGENARAGAVVVPAGRPITAGVLASASAFGAGELAVHRRVRVALLVTGDELRGVGDAVEAWQVRDSNGAALTPLLGRWPWVECAGVTHAPDDPAATVRAMRRALASADVVISTGGVSMGDHDHVTGAVSAAGGEVVYHKLAMRPGKPNLGAVGPQGQAVFGLPGNPVSALCGCLVLALAGMRKLGGFTSPLPVWPVIELAESSTPNDLALWHYRPCRIEPDGRARELPNKGSGDLAALAVADGFIEHAPGSPAVRSGRFISLHG